MLQIIKRSPSCCLALVLIALLFSGSSNATHKAWVLKNSGLSCMIKSPGADPNSYWYNQYGLNYFNQDFAVGVSCPVNLANRWRKVHNGSTSPLQTRWLRTRWAGIDYFSDGGSFAGLDFSMVCNAMMGVDDSIYISDSILAGTQYGAQRLEFVNIVSGKDWGGSLLTNEESFVESLNYNCYMSPGYRAISGYDVAPCEGPCGGDANRFTTGGSAQTREEAKVSAASCSPTYSAQDAELSEHGITAKRDGIEIICPIDPPADDSRSHPRELVEGKVWIHRSRFGTQPNCTVRSIEDADILYDMGSTKLINGLGELEIEGTGTKVDEDAMMLFCTINQNQTFQGGIFDVTVSPETGGI